ncbi:MAG: AAA-like domain-containing protein [Spirochaetaceae bacterium]|jgi:hypothetical protein|nr:AAA-like domain-containing protein [Spirochaetaceae bacterium]
MENQDRPLHFFNTAGPCNQADHYMLPPEERLIGAQLERYVSGKLYWVLHAPRQTGKTTFLLDWMRQINQKGEAMAFYVTVEVCQGVDDVDEAMVLCSSCVRDAFARAKLPNPMPKKGSSETVLEDTLNNAATIVAPKPLVILFDEVDVLTGQPLIRFLRVLRGGYATRGPGVFPVSIALVGMRDLKDYITAAKDGVPPNPGSPFNIKEDSVTLGNFTQENIAHLFAQRTEETEQVITQEALDYVWEQSRGQPWIVNNLFKRATLRVLNERDFQTVTLEHLEAARKQMIEARETHLDSLEYRLNDDAVRRVIQSIVSGSSAEPLNTNSRDVQYCLDLGLIRFDSNKGFIISNPVYEEEFIRFLDDKYRTAAPPPSSWRWQKEDGSLDMDALLKEFQKFWRRHSDIWEEKEDYTEVFPHLLLLGFMQRVINGEGKIERESAAGSGRMDIMIDYKGAISIIEIKLIHSHDSPATVKEEGLEQIQRYRDKFDAKAPSYLLIFDRRPSAKKLSWDERISWKEEDGITVLGC